MGNKIVETLVGTVVLGVAGFFLFYAYTVVDVGAGGKDYPVTATFDRIDGLSVGSEVRMSGIKVGIVSGQTLDTTTYLADVEMRIASDVELPEDTSAKVASDGLLGGAYVSLDAGGSMDMLAAGDKIEFTQGSIDVMALIGQAIFSFSGGAEETENE